MPVLETDPDRCHMKYMISYHRALGAMEKNVNANKSSTAVCGRFKNGRSSLVRHNTTIMNRMPTAVVASRGFLLFSFIKVFSSRVLRRDTRFV